MYNSEDDKAGINNPQGTDLAPKKQNVWSQELHGTTEKHGLSPRGKKQDKHASQHQPSTSETSSSPMTRSKSKGF